MICDSDFSSSILMASTLAVLSLLGLYSARIANSSLSLSFSLSLSLSLYFYLERSCFSSSQWMSYWQFCGLNVGVSKEDANWRGSRWRWLIASRGSMDEMELRELMIFSMRSDFSSSISGSSLSIFSKSTLVQLIMAILWCLTFWMRLTFSFFTSSPICSFSKQWLILPIWSSHRASNSPFMPYNFSISLLSLSYYSTATSSMGYGSTYFARSRRRVAFSSLERVLTYSCRLMFQPKWLCGFVLLFLRAELPTLTFCSNCSQFLRSVLVEARQKLSPTSTNTEESSFLASLDLDLSLETDFLATASIDLLFAALLVTSFFFMFKNY